MLMYEIQLKEYYKRIRTEKVETAKKLKETLELDKAKDDREKDEKLREEREEGEERDRHLLEEIHNLKQEVERLRFEGTAEGPRIGNICTCNWKVGQSNVASNKT